MERREFLRTTSAAVTAPFILSTSAAAEQNPRMDGLWIRDFDESDFKATVRILRDFQNGLSNREDEALTTLSADVVEHGEPLVELYDMSSAEALEHSLNYGPRLDNTDVRLVFSILEEVEGAYAMEIPRRHILAASRRAFLMKSLIAATLNFYQACEAIVSAPELTDPLRRDFYYSLVILLVEVVLAKYPFDYWIAWRTTRYVHNQFLVRARSILGTSGIAIIMKFIHWTLVRRQINVDFAKSFVPALVTFGLDHGEDIYRNTLNALDQVEDGYTLERVEDYGTETKLSISDNPAHFVAKDLIDPLAGVEIPNEGEKDQALQNAIIEYMSADTLDEVLGMNHDGFTDNVISILIGNQ